jgi:hypothetical protein
LLAQIDKQYPENHLNLGSDGFFGNFTIGAELYEKIYQKEPGEVGMSNVWGPDSGDIEAVRKSADNMNQKRKENGQSPLVEGEDFFILPYENEGKNLYHGYYVHKVQPK